jgi:hypothetical protein
MDVIILCIHGGVLCLRSLSNNTGWETEGKASVQSMDIMHIAFTSPSAACMSHVFLVNCVSVECDFLKPA